MDRALRDAVGSASARLTVLRSFSSAGGCSRLVVAMPGKSALLLLDFVSVFLVPLRGDSFLCLLDEFLTEPCSNAVTIRQNGRYQPFGAVKPAADGPRLAIAVTEAPEDGRATRAACETLASALGLAASAVTLALGAASREKTLRVAGDPAILVPKLEALA